jgi:glycosyltransferase involved in cell wall biosynthesis
MRVGIDARTLERREDLRGIGVLVSHIVQHLLSVDVDLVLFYSQPPDGTLPPGPAKQVVLQLALRAVHTSPGAELQKRSSLASKVQPILRIIWEQLLLPPAISRERLDLYHAPANRGVPLLGKGLFIGSINDVIPLVTPYFLDSRPDPPLLTWLFRLVHRMSLAVVAWKARRIITLSECSRRDIERLFPWARGKVVVIHPGADPRYRRVADADEVQRALTRYGLPQRFLLYVGGLGQRKNISGLLRAYALLARRLLNVPALVVVGKHNAFYDPLRRLAAALGIAERVYFPGFVCTEEMPALLSAAELLAYPSFYEGFGLPVVEAMACECPVVCSETSSLPEVGGDAVLYCNPIRADDLAEQMERVLTDGALRARLIEKGLRRAREFSMDRMAAEVFRVYEETLGQAAVASAGAQRPT